jgi:hypothetical protein
LHLAGANFAAGAAIAATVQRISTGAIHSSPAAKSALWQSGKTTDKIFSVSDIMMS